MNSHKQHIHPEEQYKAFIEQSSEGIWRFELDKPLNIRRSPEAQIRHMYDYAYLAECNDAMARMYGYARAGEIVGSRLKDLLPSGDTRNIEYLRAFIRSGYRLTNATSYELDKNKDIRIFQNNLIGIIDNGYLIRAWGTQRDVTQQQKLQERMELLESVSSKLVVSLDRNIAIQDVARLLVPYMADYCRIVMVDANGEVKEIAVNHHDPAKLPLVKKLYDSYKEMPEAEYGIPSLLRSGKSQIISEVNEKVLAAYKSGRSMIRIIKKLGLTSYMGIPLIARGRVIGAITFSSVSNHRRYTRDDLKFATELSRRIALTLDNNKLYSEVQDELRERKAYEGNLAFLAHVSKILSMSLDYKATLSNFAKLAVETMADWCAVDMFDGIKVERLAFHHKDPAKVKLAHTMRNKFSSHIDTSAGVFGVLNKGKSVLYPVITDELISKSTTSREYRNFIRKLGLTSAMIVPIKIRNIPVGAISFISAGLGRIYTESDLITAEEVASRAALAIEHSMLYQESKKAIKLRDDFISMASHELRTPLTTIKMYTQVIQKQLLRKGESEMRNSFSNVDMQLSKLNTLINELLNVTRVQMGKMEFRMEPFDLKECLEKIISEIQSVNTENRIVLRGNVTGRVWGDKDRICQVMVNLLLNAIKYSHKDGKIIVSVHRNKDTISVSVRDFGIGIDAIHQKKIFEKFYRVNSDKEMTYPGLGIGLFISSEIVKQHGGVIKVHSAKGKGATFRFPLQLYSNQTV